MAPPSSSAGLPNLHPRDTTRSGEVRPRGRFTVGPYGHSSPIILQSVGLRKTAHEKITGNPPKVCPPVACGGERGVKRNPAPATRFALSLTAFPPLLEWRREVDR